MFDLLNCGEEKFRTNKNFTSTKSSASVTVMFFAFPFLHFFFFLNGTYWEVASMQMNDYKPVPEHKENWWAYTYIYFSHLDPNRDALKI